MKRILFVSVVVLALFACQQKGTSSFNYRGLAMTMPVNEFVDSMLNRGFVVDSVASDSGRTVVLASEQVKYRVLAAFKGTELLVVQETYSLSSNDSTRTMWQEVRDGLEKEYGWPDCPMLKDDHKIANFDAGDGLIAVILENTYSPMLTVRYSKKTEE